MRNSMNEKNILFIAPDYYGFNEVIYEGLQLYSGAKITHAISAFTESYKYKNIGEKIYNFFLKTFFNKNLKKIKREIEFNKIVGSHSFYDMIIINRPDILSEETLNNLKNISGKMIAVYWDSMEKIKGQKETIPFFDVCYSFDEQDCIDFSLTKNNNFYFATNSENTIPKYDVLFFGTEDKRISDLNKILDYLNKKNIKAKALLYNHKSVASQPHPNYPYIDLANKLVKFKEAYKVNLETKIILDLAHENQSGLSFRPFEAMGLKKKLITTNKNISSYDFFNPQNIHIVNTENIHIPSDFLLTPYEDVPEDIMYKYSWESWIKNICK